MIAKVAKEVHMLNSHVAWGLAALDAAKAEGKSKIHIAKLKLIINKGQLAHDEVTVNHEELGFSLKVFDT